MFKAFTKHVFFFKNDNLEPFWVQRNCHEIEKSVPIHFINPLFLRIAQTLRKLQPWPDVILWNQLYSWWEMLVDRQNFAFSSVRLLNGKDNPPNPLTRIPYEQ